jgi:vitamin B12 transporter
MRLSTVCVLVGFLLPAAAVGQEPTRGDSSRSDTTQARLLQPVVITGSRVPTRADQLGFAVSAIDLGELRAEPAAFAVTPLAWAPGIAVDQGAGVGGPTVLRLRGGEEPFTQVMFDGVPINLTGGFLDLQGLTLTNVERVEVVRGPLSAQYGSSAISGVVQFVTRRGRMGPPRYEVIGEGGTAAENGGQARSQVSVAGGSRTVQYSLGGGYAYARGIYDLPHDLTTGDLSGRLDVALSDGWSVDATARYMDISSNLPVRDQGITRVPLDPNQRDDRTRLIAATGIGFDPNSTWHNRVSYSAMRDDFTYIDEMDGLDPADYPFFVFDFDFQLRSVLWRHSAEYVGTNQVRLGGQSTIDISYGASAQWEDLAVEQMGDFGDENSTYDRDNQAAFAELQGNVGPRVRYLTGARLEKFTGLSAQVIPRANVLVSVIGNTLALRAAVGKAFKAPNLQQQFLVNPFTDPNPDLEPETSVSWEVGAVGTATGIGLSGGVTFFHQSFEDLIRLVPTMDGTKSTNDNVGAARSLGVEFEVQRWWSERILTGLNLTWIDAEVTDNTGLPGNLYPVGSKLTAVPNVSGNLLLDWGVTDRLRIASRARYVGGQEVLTDRFSGDRVELDPYVLLGLTVHYRFVGQITGYVRGENLLDVSYETAYDRPGIPATVAVGVRVAN